MFEYKDPTFYTSYFQDLDGFKLIEEFKQSQDENIYFGVIEALDTIHPLIIRVEIPMSFPHMRLLFRTKSLSGYPHLINDGNDNGSWFCLNSPFAETPEAQLDQEVTRLKEWLQRQMQKDLPPVIEDPMVRRALAFANAYEWENLDEVHEFCSKAILTFVGNFHKSTDYFKNNKGYLNCVKTHDMRFYALQNYSLTNFKLPYVIVDEYPLNKESFDFIQLKDQYGWDFDMCEHLLPSMDAGKEWICNSRSVSFEEYSEEEALSFLKDIEDELNKEFSYLNATTGEFPSNSGGSVLVPAGAKELLKKEIDELKAKVLKDHKYKFSFGLDYENMTEDEMAYQSYIEDEADKIPYRYKYFALGIRKDNTIDWRIVFTNTKSRKAEQYNFDLKLNRPNLQKVIAHPVHLFFAQTVGEEMYFGRGSFSPSICNKKIAIVGVGAIGSIVAESMARSGVAKIGLWDNDIVEPGNICRSAYSLKDLGSSKVEAMTSIIRSINPYVKSEELFKSGSWYEYNLNYSAYRNGSFYGDVSYSNQEDAVKQIEKYDLIIDCTGSNEMLHFLSYAVPHVPVISLCITNKAKELLCVSSKNGNPFELRRVYLSRIEQDTKNYYIEGEGCYSPTFFATSSDISSLVNLALKDLNKSFSENSLMHTTIYSYDDRGILSDRMFTYKLKGYDIIMNIPRETLLDAEYMDESIGYLLGAYSRDGMQIMVTHIISASNAEPILNEAFSSSKGIIDYIGDFEYSIPGTSTYSESSFDTIRQKASDPSINTNNPLLAVRIPDGLDSDGHSLRFYLYINDELVPFILKN